MGRTKRPNPQGYMRISEHLQELRKRLLLSLLGLGLGAIGGWFLVDPVLQWMLKPLLEIPRSTPTINFQTIGAAFDLRIQISIWLGFLLTSPWWIYQIGAFLGPGLRRKEKLYVLSFGLVGVILFLLGALSGVWVVPKAVELLNSFTPENTQMLLQADLYISFFMRIVLAFAISCLVPEILVVLNFWRILPAKLLIKGWRWAVVAAFVFAAIANPLPTAWPMIVQALGLLLLYWLAVAICVLNDYRHRHGRFWRPAWFKHRHSN